MTFVVILRNNPLQIRCGKVRPERQKTEQKLNQTLQVFRVVLYVILNYLECGNYTDDKCLGNLSCC